MTAPPRSAPQQILAVIPTLNEAGHIAACLQSLIGTDPFMAGVAIVVADGGSTDGTQDIVAGLAQTHPNLAHSNLTLIDNPDRLQSAALNRAVDTCAQPGHVFLVRCDAHSIYPPGYIRAVADSLAARPEAASVATVMDAAGGGSCFQTAAAWIVDTPLGSGGSAHRGGTRSGWVDHAHHAGFRLDWFRRIGGYDTGFSHNEDAEYDHRLGLAGGRVWLDADIRMTYHMRPSLRALARQYWNYGRGRARTVLKHRMRPRLRQMIPAVNAAVLAISLVCAPFWPLLLAIPLAYCALLAAISVYAAWRMASPCGLYAGPALAAIHNAWGAGFIWHCLRISR